MVVAGGEEVELGEEADEGQEAGEGEEEDGDVGCEYPGNMQDNAARPSLRI